MEKSNIIDNITGLRNAAFLGIMALPALYYSISVDSSYYQRSEIDVNQENYTSTKPASGFVAHELDCLAKNIYFEARGESTTEQIAVANVTLNRVISKHYKADTVCEVVYQPSQFSWTLESDSYKTIRDDKAWKKSKAIAEKVFQSDASEDIAQGSTHYYAHDLISAPFWVESGYDIIKMAGHTYMKLKNGV